MVARFVNPLRVGVFLAVRKQVGESSIEAGAFQSSNESSSPNWNRSSLTLPVPITVFKVLIMKRS
jgi:hypothetical protein